MRHHISKQPHRIPLRQLQESPDAACERKRPKIDESGPTHPFSLAEEDDERGATAVLAAGLGIKGVGLNFTRNIGSEAPAPNSPRHNFGDHVKINLSDAWKNGDRIIDSVIGRLPNLILAVVIFAIFAMLASAAKRLVRRAANRQQRRQSLGILLGQLTQTIIVILGFLIALSVIAPSFQASDLIKVLGIGSIAIGFAFQNILQNFLAGILLLIQEPFRVGDTISVTGLEGRVEDIQARATIITAENGRTVVIPNAVLFTNAVAVAGPTEKETGKTPADVEPYTGGASSPP